ncbi:TetR/AcrR family transcriptional regulator [Microbacterium mangrovi]|uniref:TetR/AcrR family transcriptional regulator n=1 Tax=Microbacterium mangrovi TaxID=1348253 RepID=UPI0018CD4AB2|nr:TetR family transcriptional regulator [Microbacterium mangrovi]
MKTSPPPGRGRGRPRTAVIDRERIVDAALAQLRADGLEGLTMRSLADRLGVAVSALYNHVPSRAAVLAAVQERFVTGLDVSGFGSVPLRQALARWAWSYLGRLREQPELVPVIVAVPVAQAPRTSAMYQRVVGGFSAAGWPPESIIASMSILETFIFGAALDTPGPDDVYAPHDPAQSPLLARTYEAFADAVGDSRARPHDVVFAIGLDATLTGLHQLWASGRGWDAVVVPSRPAAAPASPIGSA